MKNQIKKYAVTTGLVTVALGFTACGSDANSGANGGSNPSTSAVVAQDVFVEKFVAAMCDNKLRCQDKDATDGYSTHAACVKAERDAMQIEFDLRAKEYGTSAAYDGEAAHRCVEAVGKGACGLATSLAQVGICGLVLRGSTQQGDMCLIDADCQLGRCQFSGQSFGPCGKKCAPAANPGDTCTGAANCPLETHECALLSAMSCGNGLACSPKSNTCAPILDVAAEFEALTSETKKPGGGGEPVKELKEDETCGFGDAKCGAGLYCQRYDNKENEPGIVDVNKCRKRIKLGEKCTFYRWGCEGELLCFKADKSDKDGTCQPPLAVGKVCKQSDVLDGSSPNPCATGAVCSPPVGIPHNTKATSHCVGLVKAGEACKGSMACFQSDQRCIGKEGGDEGTCGDLPGDGEPCEFGFRCAKPAKCVAGPVKDGVTQMVCKSGGLVGAACEPGGCFDGLACGEDKVCHLKPGKGLACLVGADGNKHCAGLYKCGDENTCALTMCK